MRVRIRYFGQFKDLTGLEEESLELPEGCTVAEARELVKQRHPPLASKEQILVALPEGCTVAEARELVKQRHPPLASKEQILVALNGSFGDLGDKVREGDELAFFPPVSGG